MRLPIAHRSLTAATVVCCALWAASPSLAASPRHAPNHRITHSTSTNWSGYAVSGGRYTTVSSSWTQPSVSCTSTATYSAFWVGLDGDTTSTVEQTGTEADCSGGSPVYYGWYEMYPKFPVNYSDPLSPGDQLTASVTYGGNGSFQLVLRDTSKGWSHSVTARLKSAKLGSAEAIAEAPSGSGGVLPLADFSSVGFAGTKVNGAALTSSTPGIDSIEMVNSSGVVKAEITKTVDSLGDFTDSWFHS